jgi:hypothetical protein
MKAQTLAFLILLASGTCARADSTSYAQCGTYDAYLLLYRSTEKFEELGKLRCGEKVEIIDHKGSYAKVRTTDGRLGWVRAADLAEEPPPPQHVFTFGLTEEPKPVEPSSPKPPASAITTDDVLAMHAMHPGSDFILKQIASNRCAFDLAPQQIQRLRAAGVSDKVILAMLQAPLATDAPDPKTPDSIDVKVPDGTEFEVALKGNVSSEELQEGTVVDMEAAEDLVVDGVPIVVKGSQAHARVLAVRSPGTHGSGAVAWFMQDITATNGERIPLNFASKQPDSGKTKIFEGYPYFLTGFHKDDPAIKDSDQRFRVVVHGDTFLIFNNESLSASVPRSKSKTQPVREVATKPAVPAEPAADSSSGSDQASHKNF